MAPKVAAAKARLAGRRGVLRRPAARPPKVERSRRGKEPGPRRSRKPKVPKEDSTMEHTVEQWRNGYSVDWTLLPVDEISVGQLVVLDEASHLETSVQVAGIVWSSSRSTR